MPRRQVTSESRIVVFANFRSRREDRPDERIRAGVCTRAEVIFCAVDPLFFFSSTDHLPTLPLDPLSSRLFVSTLFIPRLNLRRPTFFPPRPFSVSLTPFLFESSSLFYLALSFRIYARKVRHAARDTLLA